MGAVFFLIVLVCSIVLSPHLAKAVSYGYIDLNPAGYTSSNTDGISGGMVVGNASRTAAGPGVPMLWNTNNNTNTPLTIPALGQAFGIDGNLEVGGTIPGSALLWTSPTSYTVLDSAGYLPSLATGISGTRIVGSAGVGGEPHAVFWNGPAASPIDLNPAGSVQSFGEAINSHHEVGHAGFASGDFAILWSDSPDEYVNLNPSGFHSSVALGISPDDSQEVGSGQPAGAVYPHALLWTGTADSYVDLQPTGFDNSSANATNGTTQVGAGTINGVVYALAWNGSAESVVNLGSVIVGATSSEANAIDASGDIVGDATINGESHAVLWYPIVPEPSGILPGLAGCCLLAGIFRRKYNNIGDRVRP